MSYLITLDGLADRLENEANRAANAAQYCDHGATHRQEIARATGLRSEAAAVRSAMNEVADLRAQLNGPINDDSGES